MRGLLLLLAFGMVTSCHESEGIIGHSDASVEPDIDVAVDTDSAVDIVFTDTTYDPAPPDCRPTTPRGDCNVIHQCECPMGRWCVWKVSPDIMSSCEAFEQCVELPHLGLAPGQACDSVSSEHPCLPGSTCLDSGFQRPTPIGTCWEFCNTDWDCTVPGSRCSISANISIVGCPTTITLPSNLCSQV